MKQVLYKTINEEVIAYFEWNEALTWKWDTNWEAYEDLLINFISNG
jgi:hypothetical protein